MTSFTALAAFSLQQLGGGTDSTGDGSASNRFDIGGLGQDRRVRSMAGIKCNQAGDQDRGEEYSGRGFHGEQPGIVDTGTTSSRRSSG